MASCAQAALEAQKEALITTRNQQKEIARLRAQLTEKETEIFEKVTSADRSDAKHRELTDAKHRDLTDAKLRELTDAKLHRKEIAKLRFLLIVQHSHTRRVTAVFGANNWQEEYRIVNRHIWIDLHHRVVAAEKTQHMAALDILSRTSAQGRRPRL